MPSCKPLTPAGAPFASRQRAAGTPLALPATRCSERFATEVHCANRSFFFSRRDVGDHRWFETLVRTAAPGGGYSTARVGVPRELLLSHNVAVLCERGRWLVAYGGMAHERGSEDWHGGDFGVMRAFADAGAPELAWSRPRLVIPGAPAATGCIDRMAARLCEYDGKVSAVRFRGRTHLFTRSNLVPTGGGRHVQVASSADGVTGWTCFEQLQIDGVRAFDAEFNLYFWTVRTVRLGDGSGGRALLAIFPAVMEEVGGVYAALSSDGVAWSRPVRLLGAPEMNGRTDLWPVDGELPASSGSGAVRVAVQHSVDLREHKSPAMDADCRVRPHTCVYELSARRLVQHGRAHLDNASARACTRHRRPRSCPAGTQFREMPQCAATPPRQPKANGGDATALRDYLAAVYPAAAASVRAMAPARLRSLFRSLDYFYAGCDASRLAALRPPLPRCPPLRAGAADAPLPPYVPAGAYYRAARAAPPARYFADASFDRHASPVALLRAPLPLHAAGSLLSSHGAKLGPAPSWTNPLALVRYPLYPAGLTHNGSKQLFGGAGPSFALGNASDDGARRVASLLRVRDGDSIEVEQWGGWATAQCPPICGLWANVWRGTGVALRLSAPFASLSKGTAVAEMVLEVGRRSDAALRTLAAALHVDGAARDLAARHPAASFAACVAAAILQGHPCEGALGGEAGALVRPWIRRGARQSPDRFLEALLRLSHAPDGGGRAAAERFAVHWVYGICGIGAARARTGLGWDGLVAALACVLGHQSVVLAASANDNGLLHQEVVDFELPEGLGWAARADGVGTNDVRHCVDDPFGWAKDDEDAGDAAVRRRRRQILAYYREARKFVLPAPRDPDGAAAAADGAPCELAFGPPGADPAGAPRACVVRGDDEEAPPSADKACYASCAGSLSATHAAAALSHVVA